MGRYLLSDILRNAYTRLLLLVFLGLTVLAGVLLYQTYTGQVEAYESSEYEKLRAVATTMSLQADGEAWTHTLASHPEKDDIMGNRQDSTYAMYYALFLSAQKLNEIKTPIYSLHWDHESDEFFFGFSSADEPHYRHRYESFPQLLREQYDEGGLLPTYEDENGTWMSAFAPVKTADGSTVGVILVDHEYGAFIDGVRQRTYGRLGLVAGLFLLIGAFIVVATRRFLRSERKVRGQIEEASHLIARKNQNITDSIRYAQRLQTAILPSAEELNVSCDQSFVYYQPRDIVSGDFYWCGTLSCGRQVVVGADCTGHGVPGAFMSVLGASLLSEAVNERDLSEPLLILDHMEAGLSRALSKETREDAPPDGMDLALLIIDANQRSVTYAGAYRPLWLVRGGELVETRGTRRSLGAGMSEERPFKAHTLELVAGDWLYVASDGYADQFGGPDQKKFGSKALKALLIEISDLEPSAQAELLRDRFEGWRGSSSQMDDVLVMGLGF